MKGGLRLAQSLGLQRAEKIGIFKDFSSPPGAPSGTLKKRDSKACSASQKLRVLPRFSGRSIACRPAARTSTAARNLAGIDAKNFAGRADVGERGRIGAGHPDLCAEF